MLRIIGDTGGEYFNIKCETCGQLVELHDGRWVGAVPQVKAACNQCGQTGDFKVHLSDRGIGYRPKWPTTVQRGFPLRFALIYLGFVDPPFSAFSAMTPDS